MRGRLATGHAVLEKSCISLGPGYGFSGAVVFFLPWGTVRSGRFARWMSGLLCAFRARFLEAGRMDDGRLTWAKMGLTCTCITEAVTAVVWRGYVFLQRTAGC
jgi:hypothetical protein